ncbi:MAG TPA: glycosyltransferase family 2 protein [Cyclobacteriaceae bacterium]
MDVSVIIINYNTFALTSACIKSVIDKTVGIEYEIILIDNNSTETDPEQFLKLFPEIVLIRSPHNSGFSKGCNLGIQQSKGEYILLLNSDTVLINNAITICLEFLKEDSSVAVVSSRLEYPDGNVQHNCQRFPSIKYGLFELFRLQKFFPKRVRGKILFGYFFNCDAVAYPDWVWGTFFMFEREKLNRLPGGKLADNFFMYVEDMQWCMDFRLLGFSIALQPKAKVVHYLGKSAVQKKGEMMLRNTSVFMKRYYNTIEIKLIKYIYRALTKEELF